MTTGIPHDLDELLPAIVSGDAVAFGKLAAAIELDLRRSLRSFATRVDVEAVVQEGLLRTWQVAPRFVPDGKPNGLARLCQRITRNVALDECRKRRDVPSEIEVERVPALAPEVASDPLLRAHVLACLEALHERPRAALMLRIGCEGGESDVDLAARASMTLNTFLQNVTRARKLLEACLTRRGVSQAEVGP